MIRGFSKTSSQYTPATEAADVSRLLDPYYAAPPTTSSSRYSYPPHSSSSSSSPSSASAHLDDLQPRAYVDPYGNLHDPDFRAFPTFPGRRPSYERDDEDMDDDDAHTRFWKKQRRAAVARRASLSLLPSSPSAPRRAAEPVNFYHRPSFEESVVWDDPPYALRSTFEDDAEDEKRLTR